MPVKVHYSLGRAYYQYGSKGAKYYYKPNDPASRAKALKKAKLQERAIIASGYKEK